MKRLLSAAAVGAVCMLGAGGAQAAVLSYSGLVQNTEIDDYFFTVTAAGLVTIDVTESVLGDPPNQGNFDSEINLFVDDGNLTLDDFVENDDDGGFGLESMISRNLAAGSYLLRIGTHNFGDSIGSDPVIIAASNSGGHHGWTDYDLNIRGDVVETSAVPLPAAMPLLAGALGLFGWVGRRRRKS